MRAGKISQRLFGLVVVCLALPRVDALACQDRTASLAVRPDVDAAPDRAPAAVELAGLLKVADHGKGTQNPVMLMLVGMVQGGTGGVPGSV